MERKKTKIIERRKFFYVLSDIYYWKLTQNKFFTTTKCWLIYKNPEENLDNLNLITVGM